VGKKDEPVYGSTLLPECVHKGVTVGTAREACRAGEQQWARAGAVQPPVGEAHQLSQTFVLAGGQHHTVT